VFDSIDGAVRSVVKIQQQVPIHDAGQPDDRTIRFRVGVNIGDAIADGTDLHGDAVNVAVRLQAECPPGGICVTQPVRDYVQDRLDVAFEQLGPLSLKNIARPVEAFVVRFDAAATALKTAQRSVLDGEDEVLSLPDKPSIAVLAFANMSGDPDQEYFSDGIAEDIITALSQVRWLFVIARNSSFTFKGRSNDIKQISRKLGVRYVLDGSVRRSADRLRISAQLVEASTGAHVWADRFDRRITDIFAVQDEITEAVVTAIEPAMAEAERQRAGRKAPDDLSIWELYHRGLWHFFKLTPDDANWALEFLTKAVSLDPTNAAVHVGLGLNYLLNKWIFEPQKYIEWSAVAREHGRVAVALDPLNATAHTVYGVALNNSGEHEAGISETAKGVALSQNNATAQGLHGAVLAYNGRARDGLPHLAQAIRLSPVDPLRWLWTFHTSMANYFVGDYAASAAAGRELCRMQPDSFIGYRVLFVALAELDRLDEAHRYADLIYDRFNDDMRALLEVRWLQWHEADYAAYVRTIAKGGLTLRDGKLIRAD
jgi:adenylate cyclase